MNASFFLCPLCFHSLSFFCLPCATPLCSSAGRVVVGARCLLSGHILLGTPGSQLQQAGCGHSACRRSVCCSPARPLAHVVLPWEEDYAASIQGCQRSFWAFCPLPRCHCELGGGYVIRVGCGQKVKDETCGLTGWVYQT